MPIPDFQSIMLPFLQLTADGQDHTLQAIVSALADEFNLTPAERIEPLPSGFQAKFTNRVGWAATHLSKAALLQRTGRGRYRLSDLGRGLLETHPSSVGMATLAEFPDYVKWRAGQASEAAAPAADAGQSELSPEEAIEVAALRIRQDLAVEILEQIALSPPSFFEQLVVDLLVAMGYGGSRRDAASAVGKSGDEGIDGIIKEDRLGLDVVYVQAKRWKETIGRPLVQMFAGSLEGQRATKGVFITTSAFTAEARAYVRSIGKAIVLIDGRELAELMIDHGVGVATVATYQLKRLDVDYFGS